MKVAALSLGCLLLGGCVHSLTPFGLCQAKTSQGLVGMKLTPKLAKRIERRSSSGRVRVIHPGDMTTMDLDRNRVNVTVDHREIITQITCG
jgi:hypothetical protein